MKIIKIIFFLGVFEAVFLNSLAYAQSVHEAILDLQEIISEWHKKGINDPLPTLLTTYQKANSNIVFTIPEAAIESLADGSNTFINTQRLVKPRALTRQTWQAFIALAKQPFVGYYGGGLRVDFINFNNQGYHDLSIRVINMGSAAGETYLFYTFNPVNKKFEPLIAKEAAPFVGQKGSASEFFFIGFNKKNYAVYMEDNHLRLMDRNAIKRLVEGGNVEGLRFTYDYNYKVARPLNRKEAEAVLGTSAFEEATLNTKQIIPQINKALARAGQQEEEECPLIEDGNPSAYVDSWSFSFKFKKQCYYNVLTCSLDDAIGLCNLELYPDNQARKKVFTVKKRRYLKQILWSNTSF